VVSQFSVALKPFARSVIVSSALMLLHSTHYVPQASHYGPLSLLKFAVTQQSHRLAFEIALYLPA
jgi:hypothetical protein